MLAGEHPPRAAEARRDLVGDEERPVMPRQPGQRAQVRRRVEPHPGGPLHERLDDDCSERRTVLGEHLLGGGRRTACATAGATWRWNVSE